VFTSAIDLDHDWYYLVYFAVALVAVAAYVVANDVDVAAMFTQNWKLSMIVGAAAAAFLVWNVLGGEDGTARPDGAYFVFEIVWRGAMYGAVDALLLTAFPAMVAFTLMRSDVAALGRRAAFGLLTLVMTLVITATYHLGYDQFRDDGVRAPETGNVIISLPTIVSANPLGSIAAHVAMHEAAVTHAYETDTFLPPQTSAD
jgi:hypothetical protein